MLSIQPRHDEFHGRGINLAEISIAFTTAACCLVAARLADRYTRQQPLRRDDYTILISLMFSIGLTVSNCISSDHGIGKAAKSLAPTDLHISLQTFYAAQILYKLTINLTKESICLLYLHIFQSNRRFRHVVYIVMTYVFLYAVASITATIFQCTPIERVWNRNVAGTCINLTAFWYANAAANITGDFVILGLPMPVIRSLHLPSRQKWGLALVFALGGFVCITSILRMTTLDTSSKNKDQTFGTLNSTIWTTIEANTGIICACLPMLKAPLRWLFPTLFPRGEYQYTSSNPSPRESPESQRNAPTQNYDSWGRPQASRNAVNTRVRTPDSKGEDEKESGESSFSHETFAMRQQDVPLGTIKKTVHVDVSHTVDTILPDTSKDSPKEHIRTVSRARLVGEDFPSP